MFMMEQLQAASSGLWCTLRLHQIEQSYSASSLVLPLFGILTFIGISSCRRGCVWGTKFRFSVFICLSLMFPETWFGLKIWDAHIVICSRSMQLNYLTCKSVRAGKSKGS